MRRATITGWGSCVPPAVLTNHDLEGVMETSDEWITTRTGIKERRITHTETSDMAAVAGLHALAAAGADPADIDLLILATCTPDRLIPSAASFVQPKLGVVNAACLDVNAACSGFVYGMSLANGMIVSGAARRVLVIGAEKLSTLLDVDDRSTAVLFGDGAGAVVMEAAEGDEGILAVNLGTDGQLGDKLTVTGFGTEKLGPLAEEFALTMDGREIFRNAVVQMGEAAAKAVADAGLDLDDVDLLIPHQANTRIIDATARRMDLPSERVFVNIASYGNTSAASIPIALDEAIQMGRIKAGSVVVFVAFGGGLTWGAAALRWGQRTEPIATSDAKLPPTKLSGVELLEERQSERRSRRGVA
ncbi:MAG TPA: beta-ketoacyl-ACP synthase III [Acidimicrobiia bacterium]|jgi:3-oxoacyl-[acyl-carrier-protein] synthase-3|nr:beta-ketoacyl-ACP synthase III [Acidimicrobiia bacterium]